VAAWDVGLLAPGAAGTAAEAATGDLAVLQAMLDAEAALARALDARAGAAVTAAARAEHFDARGLAVRAASGGNPVIPLVADLTRAVAETDPAAAEFVHRGATSQDILDTALMLVAARVLDAVDADLRATAAALARLAARHRTTAMPARTLTQHAVPTTFGLKAAGWRSLVLDAQERLHRVRACLPAQLGGAAGTLAAFPTTTAVAPADPRPGPAPYHPARSGAPSGTPAADTPDTPPWPARQPRATAHGPGGGGPGMALVAAFAAQAGLAEPLVPWHVLRTPVADLAGGLAFCAGALGKIAADVLVLSRTEIGEVAEGSGGGSSAMPHKSNPVRATLVASCARQVPALVSVLYGSLAAEDERPAGAWHAEWLPLRQALRLTGAAAEAARVLCTGLVVRSDRMRANLDLTGGLVVAERLQTHLAPLIGRGPARDLLARACGRAASEGRTLADVLAEDPEVGAALPAARLRDLTDPTAYLGQAPALTDRALSRGGAAGAPVTHPGSPPDPPGVAGARDAPDPQDSAHWPGSSGSPGSTAR
jgi:3-carboxy-cis,cis-muconate cycloisomerase